MSIGSIVLGVLGVLGLLGGPASAQPGQTPVMRPVPPPPEAMPPPADAMPPQQGPQAQPYYPQPAPAPYPYPQPPPYEQPPPPVGPPPGSTHATFVSTGEARWDVRLDNNAVCTTPCSIYVEPLRFVTLHSQERAPTKLTVGVLGGGDVMVRAKPRAKGAFAAGVTFTTLSGMGLATGITLTAVGCSTDRGAMCQAGLITGAASGIGLYLSIKLLRSALPKFEIGPAQAAPYVAGNTVGLGGEF